MQLTYLECRTHRWERIGIHGKIVTGQYWRGATEPMTEACAIITTCGSEETALTIAAALVDQGLAACVNILTGMKSYYYYQGGTHLDEEVMLIIKSTREHFEAVSQVISELHTYEVPEILMFGVDAGSTSFLDWIQQSVGRPA